MEKDKFFVNERGNDCPPLTWNTCTLDIAKMQSNELNCSGGTNFFLNPNWRSSMDQSDLSESALSSIVSSPATSNAGVVGGGSNSVMIRELIGKLGNICNSGDLSPQSYISSNGKQSTNTSFYSTPLNTPPELNLSTMDSQIRGSLSIPQNYLPSHPNLANFSTDPGFVDRAARLSCFGAGNLSSIHGSSARPELSYRSIPVMDSVHFSRVSPTNLLVKASGSQRGSEDNSSRFTREANILPRSSTPENGEFREYQEGSLQSERTPGGKLGTKVESDSVSRKRKSVPKGKLRDTTPSPSVKDNKVEVDTEEYNSKKRKSDEATGKRNDAAKAKAEPNAGDGDKKQSNDNPKHPEPPKDYIHVRARRGQATDSHSLAERVRREKISERMKFLQDLVPGCNKVTGKAVMLDDIINYVQSLQRQVEFLSMKLTNVNPRMNFNMEAFLSKDIFQPRDKNLQQHALYSLDSSIVSIPYGCQPHSLPPQHGSNSDVVDSQFSMNTMNAALRKNPEIHMAPAGGLSENSLSDPSIWKDDLQTLVQMGFGQNRQLNIQG